MANRNKVNCLTGTGNFIFITICIFAVLCGVASGDSLPFAGKALSPSTLRAMARFYMAYGEYDKAELLAERAFAVTKKSNLQNEEQCLCLVDLAYIYCNEGKLGLAEKKCRQALNLQEKVYGTNHPYSAYTLRIIASVYRQQARFEQAQAALEQAIDIMLKTLCVADTRAVAPFQIDLANLFVQQGRYEMAEDYFMKALPAISETFGPEHLCTANVLGSIAKLYVLQGRYSQAELLITQAVTVQEKVYGPTSCLVAPAWLTMANVCWAKGDFANAEKLIQKALNAVERTGNFTELVALQQQAAQIRDIKPSAFGPVAKAD